MFEDSLSKNVELIIINGIDEFEKIKSSNYLFTIVFFYSCFHLYGDLPYTYLPPFSPFSPPSLSYPLSLPSFTARVTFLPYRQSYPPWECDRSHYLLRCIAFARGHRETVENLCRYSRPFNRVCPQSNSLWKMTSRSAFRCAGRRPAVTHPSADPAKSCLTWVIAWHRTPTTHRTLSVDTL